MFFGGKEYEGRFRLTPGRIVAAMALWATVWYFCFALTTLVFLISQKDPQQSSHFDILLRFSNTVGFCAAFTGFVLSIDAIFRSARRPDLEIARSPGLMPIGQAAVNSRMFGLGLIAGVVIAVYTAGVLAPASIELRAPIMRAFIGAFQGLASASVSCGLMFRVCRL